jgi:hypothetical protein
MSRIDQLSLDRTDIEYQQLGADYCDRTTAPTIQESVKSKFDAEQLIAERSIGCVVREPY